MNFSDFIKKGHVRKASSDMQLVRSLYKNTINDLAYLNTQKISEISARKVVVNYYDCLRAILEAIASLDGFKVYQHEAFRFFLKEKAEDTASVSFDRFRKIRNRINYYGQDILIEEAIELVEGMKKLISYLTDKYLKNKI